MSRPLCILSGDPLPLPLLTGIGAAKLAVRLSPEGMSRAAAGRLPVERAIAERRLVYGVTTGVGALKTRIVEPDELDRFSQELLLAHHFGIGEVMSPAVVRAAMAIRINMGLTGVVGCSPDLLTAYAALLEADVVPVVRRTGSIGCSDIGIMGQIGSALTGIGEALHGGERLPAAEALARAGLSPYRMRPKDALVALSTNAASIAGAAQDVGAVALAFRVLLATGLTAATALGAATAPWHAASRIGSANEAAIGRFLEAASGADPGASRPADQVHDPLSVRMMPQVLGAVAGALTTAVATIVGATNRADNNPVVIDDDILTSGGSLQLELALALQGVSLALAHLARNAFNRIVLLANGRSGHLPVNLVPEGSVATGFGPILKLGGDLYVQVLTDSTPVSALSAVMADGIEDEAAFTPLVVERIARQERNLRHLAALEALLAAQAIDLRRIRPHGLVRLIYEQVRSRAPFLDRDRALSFDVEAIGAALFEPEIVAELLRDHPLDGFDAQFWDPAL